MPMHVGMRELIRHHMHAAARQMAESRAVALVTESYEQYRFTFVDDVDEREQRELLIELACAALLSVMGAGPPEPT